MRQKKKALRKQLKALRKSLSPSRREAATQHLKQQTEQWIKQESLVASFVSIHDEIDTGPLNQALAAQEKLALPRVFLRSGAPPRLFLYKVKDLTTLITSSWGISEPDPKSCEQLQTEKLSLIIVPGLAFDSRYHRLGYGKGLYDGLLASLPTSCKTVGLGFKEQLMAEELPREPHDVALQELFLC